jgi:hypothetical protein
MAQKKGLASIILKQIKRNKMKTIYQMAQVAMDLEIARYLELLKATDGLASIKKSDLESSETSLLFAGGIGSDIPQDCDDVPQFLIAENNRKSAISFDVETAVCIGVYSSIRPHAKDLYLAAKQETNNFTTFDADNIKEKPHLLPVFQSTLKLSKSQLKKKVGSVSDNSISGPASIRLAEQLTDNLKPNDFQEENVLQRMEVTLEGIVRDLVGRVLFEEVVAHALEKEEVNFLREEEYSSISGVVYDFRADFVLPNPENPIAFIEVRKSSSRHASLYAKDKMFSAINWKGKHKNLIGVIVVEGEWTQTTLRTMASVFDYVVPLSKATELAKILRSAQDGDESVLKWLIQFSITPSPKFSGNGLTSQ